MDRREFLAVTGVAAGSTFIPTTTRGPKGLPTSISPTATKLPVVRIVGIGGAGCNLINKLRAEAPRLNAVLVAINSNARALEQCSADLKVQIGKKLTRGLGAGARPVTGRRSAIENYDDIRAAVSGADIVIMHCGLGGGCGTGAAPFVAQTSKQAGAYVIAVPTLPFRFEGRKRWIQSQWGLAALTPVIDEIIAFPQDQLVNIATWNLCFQDAIELSDHIVANTAIALTIRILRV